MPIHVKRGISDLDNYRAGNCENETKKCIQVLASNPPHCSRRPVYTLLLEII